MSYESVRSRMAQAAASAGRNVDDVTLVAVSKGRSVEAISHLYELGHRDFGENRAGELAEKAPQLPTDIRWHFVGHLQSNKVRSVRPMVARLHSLDRTSLAKAWLKGRGPVPPCFVQVNIGRESQKSGVDPTGVAEAVSAFQTAGIPVVGLMAILPIVGEPVEAVPFFDEMVELRNASGLDETAELSMGMTDDFEVAIERGATVIRVGRAIFEPNRSA